MEDSLKHTTNCGETKPETSSSSDFEFGSLTPSSPSQDPFSENSPADHLFLNGRLLPHTFPARTTRSMSRTTSESTFRSNSSSSQSSDSSSPTSYTPRTSSASVSKVTSLNIGDGQKAKLTCFSPRSEEIMGLRSGDFRRIKEYYHKPSLVLDLKKKPHTNNGKTVNTSATNKTSYLSQCKRKKATEIVTAQLYGPYTRRWQHITPVFKREGSVKSNGGGIKVGGRKNKTARKTNKKRKEKKKKKAEERRGISKLIKWWKRILNAVVFACKECHAMEPQILVNDDVKMKIITKCP